MNEALEAPQANVPGAPSSPRKLIYNHVWLLKDVRAGKFYGSGVSASILDISFFHCFLSFGVFGFHSFLSMFTKIYWAVKI